MDKGARESEHCCWASVSCPETCTLIIPRAERGNCQSKGDPQVTAVFVHLSDIHFGQERTLGRRAVNNDARRQLIEDAAMVVAQTHNRVASGIIVTGDIAFAGKQDEYRAAGAWLDELADRVGCRRTDIQLVPGNHDIDRHKIDQVTGMLLDRIFLEGEEALDLLLEEEASREVLYRRFDEYRAFADAYQCPLDCTGQNSNDRRVELAPGRAIRFIRLNSALLCGRRKDEYGKLLLGARQRVMEGAHGEELVVLTHHPFGWYADSEDALRFVRGRARVFISGHEHMAAVNVDHVEEGCDLMMLAAGATTPDKAEGTYTYAYNVIEFDWDDANDALGVTLHPRAWNDEMKRFEGDEARLQGRASRTTLGAPFFKKAQRPAVAVTRQRPSPRVEIVSAISGAVAPPINEAEHQELHLRFFRDLSEGERLRILFELDAVPATIRNINHQAESLFFRGAIRKGRATELRKLIDDALGTQDQKVGSDV